MLEDKQRETIMSANNPFVSSLGLSILTWLRYVLWEIPFYLLLTNPLRRNWRYWAEWALLGMWLAIVSSFLWGIRQLLQGDSTWFWWTFGLYFGLTFVFELIGFALSRMPDGDQNDEGYEEG